MDTGHLQVMHSWCVIMIMVYRIVLTHSPGKRSSVHQVVDLMRIQEFAKAPDEVHALLTSAFHVDQNKQRGLAFGQHVSLTDAKKTSTTIKHQKNNQQEDPTNCETKAADVLANF